MALGAGSPKDSLAVLLSNGWIDGGTIDMMMSQLATRVRLNHNLRETTVVATLNLQMQINKAYKDRNFSRGSVPLLSRYTELFKNKKCTCLFFPAHISTNHWVAFLIDFQEGDYLSWLVHESVQLICKSVIFELFRRLPCTPFIQNGHFKASQESTGLAESRIWKGIQI